MGNNLSYQRDKKWETIQEVINDNVNDIGFHLGQRDNDILRHTSIVLSFNSQPRYVIDFGATDGEHLGGVIGSDVFGDIQVHDFESANIKLPLISPIAEFRATSQDDRKKVQNLCKVIIDQIALKDFSLLENNCHHYVIVVYGMIVAFENQMNCHQDQIDWNLIETAAKKENVENLLATSESELVKHIKELMKKDSERLNEQSKIIAGVGGGVGGAAALAAGGGLTFLGVTTGITATAGIIAAGVATGGIALAAIGLGIGIAGIVKVAKMKKEQKQKRK